MDNHQGSQNKNNQNGGFGMEPGGEHKIGNIHPSWKAHKKIRCQGSHNTEEGCFVTEVGEKQKEHNDPIDANIFSMPMKK